MPVRLNKALKELNVGINTVAEFLQKKGKALQDASPNAKITDEQYKLLMDAFGADKTKHEEISKRRERERQEKERLKQEKRQKQETIFRTQSESKQQFKVVGNIKDLQKKEEEKKEEVKRKEAKTSELKVTPPSVDTPPVKSEDLAIVPDVKTEVPEPSETAENEKETVTAETHPKEDATVTASAPDEEQIDETAPEKEESATEVITKPAEHTQKEKKQKQRVLGKVDDDGVFRTETPTTGVKQVGFIDLSNINSKTRPDKKSKAEKRKEREEKERQRKEAKEAMGIRQKAQTHQNR